MQLLYTQLMEDIGASLESTHEVNLHYEVIIDEGKVSVFIPELKFRLLTPKDNLMELQRLENIEGSLNVTWDKSVLKISYQVPITTHY